MRTINTRETVQQWFDAIGRGDIDTVLDGLSETVYHELPADERNTVVPNLGVHLGRDSVAESFRMRGGASEGLEYRTLDLVVEDTKAYVVTWAVMRQRATGKTFGIEATHRLTLDEQGKIDYWKVYFDPTPEVAAFDLDVDTRLVDAVRRGAAEDVRALLAARADAGTREQSSGLTVLMIAAGRGDTTVTRLLVEGGADVSATDDRAGGTALHKAVQGGDLPTVKVLLDAGAFIDAVSVTTGHTPLLDAFWYKWPEIVELLLERDASVNLDTHYGFSMRDHFDYAVQANAVGGDKLLTAQQFLQERIRRDETAVAEQELMAAVLRNDVDTVREQIAGGVDVDARYPILNGFHDAHTPLLVACREGYEEIVDALLDAGADVNAVEPTFGAVPLHKAVYNGNADIARRLTTRPGIDIDYQGATNGYSPLHDSIWHGYEDCARILLDAGARRDLLGHDGRTPADMARMVFGDAHPLTADLNSALRAAA